MPIIKVNKKQSCGISEIDATRKRKEMNKLEKICSMCKAAVYFTYNDHKSVYESIESNLEESVLSVDKSILNEMIRLDKCYNLQFYPHTAIGSYDLYHYDLEKLLDQALEILEDK